MPTIPPKHERFLRDAFGSPRLDGSCVLDADGEAGYVKLEFGTPRGTGTLTRDSLLSVMQTRTAHPLRGSMVNLIGHAS